MRVFVALLIVGLSLLLASWLQHQAETSPVAHELGTDSPGARHATPVTATPDASSERSVAVTLPEEHPLSETMCPRGMAWVQGQYCPLPAEGGGACRVPPRTIAVCIDEFEYPNQQGVYPAVMINARSARRICAAEDKRLCRDSEWTLACQSTVERNGCNVGQMDKLVRVQRLHHAEHVSEELAAHDGRRLSRPTACVNQSRVFDLLGNVQEWVQTEHPEGYEGSLKGGRYNQGLISCERSIQVKDPWARYPHTGLRCCADPLVELPGVK